MSAAYWLVSLAVSAPTKGLTLPNQSVIKMFYSCVCQLRFSPSSLYQVNIDHDCTAANNLAPNLEFLTIFRASTASSSKMLLVVQEGSLC